MAAPIVAGLGRLLMGGMGRGALATGVRAGVRGGVRQGIRSGLRQGVRNTFRGGGRGSGGGRGGALVKATNNSAITRSENGGLAVQGRTIKEGGALSSSLGPSSQKSSAIVKTGPTRDNVLGLLEDIKKTADQILEVEVKELDNDNKEYKDAKKEKNEERKLLEAEKRDEEEEKQEANKAKKGRKRKNPVVKAAQKGLGNIFEFLMDMFKQFVLYKILDWVGDPKNREKVAQLVKFIGAIPGALKFVWKNFLEPWWVFTKKLFGGGFKIFMAFFNVVKDLVTLKFLTNPGEFFNTLMEIPKTIIEVVPGIIGSLLNAITGGAIQRVGDLVGGLFNDPLKGIDLSSVTSLLGSAAGFVTGLLGNAWTGITNAVGNLFGGGGNKQTPAPSPAAGSNTSAADQSGGLGTPDSAAKSETPAAASSSIAANAGVEALGSRNFGLTEGNSLDVGVKGKSYRFTKTSDGWKVEDGGVFGFNRQEVDPTKVEGLVAAFASRYENRGASKEDEGMSDPTGRSTAEPKAPSPPGGGGNPYNMVVTSAAMQNRGLAISPGMHMGVDIANGKAGAPLQAFTDATITGNGVPSAGYGNWVSWTDTAGLEHFYAHMERPTPFKVGDKVKAGTKLGSVGNTGKSSGPHLHWEVSTKPGDTGMPKSAVLSRINPLSKYAFTAPFGGSTAPASSSATAAPPAAPADMQSSPPKSGSNLGAAQQENRQLSSSPTQRQQPTVVNNASSTQATSESSTDSGIGSTLPTSGTWAIYSLAI